MNAILGMGTVYSLDTWSLIPGLSAMHSPQCVKEEEDSREETIEKPMVMRF